MYDYPADSLFVEWSSGMATDFILLKGQTAYVTFVSAILDGAEADQSQIQTLCWSLNPLLLSAGL